MRLLLSSALAAVALIPFGASAAAPPPLTPPARYAADEGPARSHDNRQWWANFGDPELNRLVDEGLGGSYDLAVLEARVEQAEAVVVQQLAPLLPTASWDTTLNTGPLKSLGFQFGGGVGGGTTGMPVDLPTLFWQTSSQVGAALEVDVSGRNILRRRAAKSDRGAANSDLQAQRVVLASQIVSGYYDLVTAIVQERMVHDQVETNEQLLALTQGRFERGQATAVEVLQQRQQLAGTKTLVPQTRTQRRAFEHQLAVLLGKPPGRRFVTAEGLPPLPPAPGVGAPTDLARHRPEVEAAEHRRLAATRRTKAARRTFVPRIDLSGQYGFQGIRITDWRTQQVWGVGATLSVPLSTGGRSYGRLKEAAALERVATHQVQQAKLVAIREVEDALVREREQALAVGLYEDQAQAARAAFDESRARYAAGVSEYLPVLTALASSQRADLELVTARRDLVAARIQLHAALGDFSP